jgi:hypothetical protein
MARFAATYAITEATDWLEGEFFDATRFADQVGQPIEFFAQTHDHSGDAGDGATLTDGNEKLIFYYGPAVQ